MTGYLDRLVARAGDPPLGLAPRPRSRYEDTGATALPAVGRAETTAEPRPALAPASSLGRAPAAASVEHSEWPGPPALHSVPLAERPTALTATSAPTDAAEPRPVLQRADRQPASPTALAAAATPDPTIAPPATGVVPPAAGIAAPPTTGEDSVPASQPVIATAGPRPATIVAERAVATIEPADIADEREPASDPAPTGVVPVPVSTARRPRGRTAPVEAPAPAPVVVEVTIGRLEIRSTREPARPARPSPAPAPALTDYLRDRRRR